MTVKIIIKNIAKFASNMFRGKRRKGKVMSQEKQIEEVAKCENCIHAKVCVIRGFPSAFKNTHWEKEPCDHYRKQRGGEWKLGKSGCMYFCSECNYAAHPREVDEWSYCPRCGAKMKERISHE